MMFPTLVLFLAEKKAHSVERESKEYSDEDYDLLKELDEKFADLYGKKISEKKEER